MQLAGGGGTDPRKLREGLDWASKFKLYIYINVQKIGVYSILLGGTRGIKFYREGR